MTGTADPWEPPSIPALGWRMSRHPHVERSPGPERVCNEDPPQDWKPPAPVGFIRLHSINIHAEPSPHGGHIEIVTEEPLRWEGDDG